MKVQHYHRKVLEVADEGNPNNARVPTNISKGQRECLDRGWICINRHPYGDYDHFVVTPLGKDALKQPKPKKVKRTPQLSTLNPRLGSLPEKIGKA